MLEENVINLINGKIVTVKPIDGCRLYLNTSNIAFISRQMDKSNEHIHSIILEDKFTIQIGDEFLMNVGKVKTLYTVEYIIVEKNSKSVILYSALPTKTTKFLLPVLGKSMSNLLIDTYFVNAYLDHTYKFICLVYRFTGTDAYKLFEKQMMTDPLCVSHLEHGKYYVTYIFKIPLEFKEDVLSFVEGKYSKFSKALKERIRKFYGKKGSKYLMDIINHDKELKKSMENHLGVKLPEDSELASKPNIDIEIYKPQDK